MTARFIMVGGFLGAGKTTLIARLAAAYQGRGLSVGIVTNDRAADLVDTHRLRSQGFQVGEIAGACFCSNINDLTATIERLGTDSSGKARRPDVVLIEPVGSCTDLVATVIQPLLASPERQFDVAPYGVIVKPSHGRRVLRGEAAAGVSPKAAYLFRKQLEEADFLLIDRIDDLTAAEADELTGLLKERHPGKPVLRVSAKSGQGLPALLEYLDQRGDFARQVLDLDYDEYAAGEAELGWLNSSLAVSAAQPFSLDELLLDLVRRLRDSLAAEGAEIAHVKVLGLADAMCGVANLVSNGSEPELSLASRGRVGAARLIVNARVAIDPQPLERHVREAVRQACARLGASAEFQETRSFRPGLPLPGKQVVQLAF